MSVCCNGPCQQGRLPCPTPAACRVVAEMDHDDGIGCIAGLMTAIGALAALILLGLLIAWVAA